MVEENPIVVVGAGLAGCMTALLLARRNDGGRPRQIRLFEKRGDFREEMDRENDVSQCVRFGRAPLMNCSFVGTLPAGSDKTVTHA